MPPKVIYVSPHAREYGGIWHSEPFVSYEGEPALRYELSEESGQLWHDPADDPETDDWVLTYNAVTHEPGIHRGNHLPKNITHWRYLDAPELE